MSRSPVDYTKIIRELRVPTVASYDASTHPNAL